MGKGLDTTPATPDDLEVVPGSVDSAPGPAASRWTTLRHRALDVLFCGSFGYFSALLGMDVWIGFVATDVSLLVVPAVALVSYLSADLASGFVHWLADSYGSPTTPLLGPKFVTPFREHHADPLAITRHDFLEANGDNCGISHVVLVPAYFLLPVESDPWAAAGGLYVLLLAWFVLLTSLAHGWAHTAVPPRAVRALQRAGLLLSREHHQQHHVGDHATHYCITSGWLNPLLDKLRFFRGLERALAWVGVRRST